MLPQSRLLFFRRRLIPLFLLAGAALSRPLTSPGSALVSDGVGGSGGLLRLGRRPSAGGCEQTYGFLPCTESAVGNLFLAVVYGYLMFTAATYLSSGSELLLDVLGPGIIGGLFLPLLGALPDALLILVSGLSGTRETAQQQVLIGMGLLAGSTIMLLTVLWGSCLIVGRVGLSESSTPSQRLWIGTGVATDQQTSYAARIMVISIIPFVIVQVPQMFRLPSGRHLAVLVALIVAVVFLLAYCLYQVIDPWIQNRRIAYAKHKYMRSALLKHWQRHMLGKFLNPDGEPNQDSIKKLFDRIDSDKDNLISTSELSSLVVGMRFEEMKFDKEEAVDRIMSDFDVDHSGNLSYEEFYRGISKWISEARHIAAMPANQSTNFIEEYDRLAKENHYMLLGNRDEVNVGSVDKPRWTIFKAAMLLVLGTVIAVGFADPLVDAVDNFSDATSIPSFFISFIAMPLVTNSSEAVSAIIFASHKNQRNTSLTYSEIYGAVTMNNTLCLAVFLALVYIRQLTWDFSAEVLIILLVTVVMGLFASFRTKFSLWTCFIAFSLYPLSLVLVYVLDYIFGWS